MTKTLRHAVTISFLAVAWCQSQTTVREGVYRGRPFSEQPIYVKAWYDGKIPFGWAPAEQKSLILENEHLLVQALPERQGRIMRVVDKATGMDLVNADAIFDHFPHNNWIYLKDRLPIGRANRLGIVTQAVGLSYAYNPQWKKVGAEQGEGVEFLWQKDDAAYAVSLRLSLEGNALRLDWSCTNEGPDKLRNVVPVVRPELVPFNNFSNDPKMVPMVLLPDPKREQVQRLLLDGGGYLHAESRGASWTAMVNPSPESQGLVMSWQPSEGTQVYRYRANWWVNQSMAVFAARDLEPKDSYTVTWSVRTASPWRLKELAADLSGQMSGADLQQLVNALGSEFRRPPPTAADLVHGAAERLPKPLGHGQKPLMTFAFMGGAGLTGDERTEQTGNDFGETNLEAAVAQLNLLEPEAVFFSGVFTEAGLMDEHKQLAGTVERLRPPHHLIYPAERE